MFPIPFNFPFRKSNGDVTTIADAISSGGGSYTLPTASAETKGGVKIGTGLTMDGETLNNTNPTPYSLPTATSEILGGVKVGDSLRINDGVINDKWENFIPSITFNENAALDAGGCWKRGKIILFNMRVEISSTLQTTGNTIFTLPEGSRPSKNMYFPMVAYTTDNYMYASAYASMNDSGNMNVNRNSFNDKGLARCWFNTIIILD